MSTQTAKLVYNIKYKEPLPDLVWVCDDDPNYTDNVPNETPQYVGETASYTEKIITDPIHHDAVTEQVWIDPVTEPQWVEEVGHYETIGEGEWATQEWVVDKEGYWDEVVVEEGYWDEVVVEEPYDEPGEEIDGNTYFFTAKYESDPEIDLEYNRTIGGYIPTDADKAEGKSYLLNEIETQSLYVTPTEVIPYIIEYDDETGERTGSLNDGTWDGIWNEDVVTGIKEIWVSYPLDATGNYYTTRFNANNNWSNTIKSYGQSLVVTAYQEFEYGAKAHMGVVYDGESGNLNDTTNTYLYDHSYFGPHIDRSCWIKYYWGNDTDEPYNHCQTIFTEDTNTTLKFVFEPTGNNNYEGSRLEATANIAVDIVMPASVSFRINNNLYTVDATNNWTLDFNAENGSDIALSSATIIWEDGTSTSEGSISSQSLTNVTSNKSLALNALGHGYTQPFTLNVNVEQSATEEPNNNNMIEKYVDNAYMLRFWGRIKDIFDKGGTSYSIPNLTEAGAMSIVEHLEALYELLNDEVTDAKKHTTLEGTTGKISVTPTTDKTTGKVNYTVTVDATYVAKITKLEADYAKKLKKADVKINGNVTDTTVTVNGFGKNGSIEAGSSNKLEVNIPANPAAAMVGGSSTDKGVKVETNATGQKVGQPKVSLEAGEVAEDETKLTTGGKVYDAIKEMLSDNSETINKTTSFGADTLIPGTITVKSSTGDGEAQVTLNPTLAVPEGKTASAMATDAYVATKTNGIGTEYSFDETSVPLEPGADNVYSGTLTMSGTNGSSNTVSISINASSFVTDAFLTGSSIVTKEVTLPDSTKEDHKFLRLTVTLADGTLNNIDVDINKFIDLYKEGNGIEISDDLKVSTNATGYVTTGDNGLDLTADTLANATSTTGLVDPTKIATKKYVDSVNSEAAISVKGDASVTKFGDDKTFEITVGEGDGAQTYKFNVKLPSLTTTDTTATKNVVTTIDETGAISIATNEAAGSATGTNHKLATVGYVKEKVAGVTYTDDNATVDIPTSGTNKNKVSLVADETNGYLKVDASGVNINPSMISDGDTSTTGHDLLATEKYVANKIAEGGISITSPTSTAKLTPVDGSTSKTYKIDMEVASWDDDEGTYTF